MTGTVQIVNTDAEFSTQLTSAGDKLVVVDFFATWCGPCQTIAPVYQQLAAKYQSVVFLKLDVDEVPETAQAQGVTAMPTFNFYRNKTKVDSLRGANPASLEDKIKALAQSDTSEEEEVPPAVKGHTDLNTFINASGTECLNESDDHPLSHCLTPDGGYLESDCDEQLIASIEFNQAVKLHSLKIHGPPDKGPKRIKIFINQPRAPDFDAAERMDPVQGFELTPDDLQEDGIINLRYVKFQNVTSMCLFVKDNQDGGEVTQIDYLGIIGSTVLTTNMSDFKRVAGKKGESH